MSHAIELAHPKNVSYRPRIDSLSRAKNLKMRKFSTLKIPNRLLRGFVENKMTVEYDKKRIKWEGALACKLLKQSSETLKSNDLRRDQNG